MSKYLQGNIISNKDYENIKIRKENDLILGFRLINGINYNIFNQKYNDDLLNKDVIKKLISEDKLIIDNNHLKCNYKYIYLLNDILIDVIDSDL
jgi:coproporphyrinogen III oxidase-like Fe-S oxidoreductase